MGRKKKKKKEKYHKNKHHVIPSSIGGTNDKDNIVLIEKRKHENYHAIFSNLHPQDVVKFLVDYFFGGNDQFVRDYLNELDNTDRH